MTRGRQEGLISRLVLATALAALVLIVGVGCKNANPAASKASQSAYDRIIKSGTIRCGFVSHPPSSTKDPNTGKMTGVFVELMDMVAAKLGVKVEWTEEVGFGSMIEGLEAGRYDIVPSAIWPNVSRAMHADFSEPLFYSGVCAYVKTADRRFDGNLAAVNSPSVKIATVDGEMGDLIANTDYPKAQKVQLPQMTDLAAMLLNVKDGKADITFQERYYGVQFLKQNPGTLRDITPDRPVRIFPNTIMIPKGEYELKRLLNTAIEELLNAGVVDRLLDKYEPGPGAFYRVAEPYRVEVR